MPKQRTYRIYQAIDMAPNQVVKLDAEASSHIVRVLRLKPEQHIILFNGQGGEYHGRLSEVDKRNSKITIDQFVDRDVEEEVPTHLGQCISRGEKMDWVVQKATELGVAEITPLFSEFGNVKLDGERLEKKIKHWQKIAISACEQCGRNRIPIINPAINLIDWLPTVKPHEQAIILVPEAEQHIKNIRTHNQAARLLIGPEGGLSDFEIAAAIQQGFQPAHLGPRVLRTETAALVAILS